jgi:hypothetical protein
VPTQKRVDAEELPYFTLLRKIPIRFVEWAEKEVPVAYVISDCSNNEQSYNRDIELRNKADFYKALDDTLKPQAAVTLNYETTQVNDIVPGFSNSERIQLHFAGKDILTRGGLYQTLLKEDDQFRYVHTLKEFLRLFKIFIERNRTRIQKTLEQHKFSSPWELFQEVMQDETLRYSFFTEVETQLGKEVKGMLLAKWEREHGKEGEKK